MNINFLRFFKNSPLCSRVEIFSSAAQHEMPVPRSDGLFVFHFGSGSSRKNDIPFRLVSASYEDFVVVFSAYRMGSLGTDIHSDHDMKVLDTV